MTLPEQHFRETEALLRKVDKKKIGQWLLEQGYYPEEYVVPPSFRVKNFDLQKDPFFSVKIEQDRSGNKRYKFEPEKSELITISFPKTQLTDRTFGIINPKIYHDMVWYLLNDWNAVLNHLYHGSLKIFSYSLPIPINSQNVGELGDLRAGRMIYEFLEMAESDLVAEGHKYKFLLKTDIKNFYPSVYTHSIAWALHTKKTIRTPGNRDNFSRFLGLKLDKLFQYANDGCTNGIPIGPAISDLVSELILAAVDKGCTIELDEIDFVGVRFKDDYRFLCNSKEDARKIIKTLQNHLRDFNLFLNEGKSEVRELPEGLFRPWTSEFQKYSLKYRQKISYKRFTNSLLATLKIDQEFPDTGVIDRFLNELVTKRDNLKLKTKGKNTLKVFSLLLLLKERRTKSFPKVLAIIEKIIEENKDDKLILNSINLSIEMIIKERWRNEFENQYDLIWLIYFVRSHNLFKITYPNKINSPLIKSLKNNSIEFYKPIPSGFKIFQPIKKYSKKLSLLEYLAVFRKTNS
jgi:hypothetical protein